MCRVREIVLASQWMQSLAQSCQRPTLPDASLLWWRAQLSEKHAKVEKAQEFSIGWKSFLQSSSREVWQDGLAGIGMQSNP